MIYLIDDDDIQNLINTKVISLVSGNVPVKSFTSAEEGLKSILNDQEPNVIFLDINMPIMNGWDFLDAYVQNNLEVPVYMLSSSINQKDIDKSQTYEVVKGFISKPLIIERLKSILTENRLIPA